MKKNSARQIAYLALQNWAAEEVPVHQSLEKLFTPGLSSLEKNLAKELSQGVVRRKLTLDEVIRQYSSILFSRLDIRVLNILRLAVYQLMFLDRIPDHAAVHEAVEMAKRIVKGAGAPSFINAVLREFLRRGKTVQYPEKDILKSMSLELSYPVELIKKWAGIWGLEKARGLCEAGNVKPSYTARVNTSKISRADLLAHLNEKEEIAAPFDRHSEAVYLLNLSAALDSKSFQDGLFQVQDVIMLGAVDQLELDGNMIVLDACGAPGTKAAAMAGKIPEGRVICVDKAYSKFEQMQGNLKRLGVENVSCIAADAAGAARTFKIKFQRILADVPCSNTGVLAKRPEARWRYSPGMIKRISQLQYEILISVIKLLEEGGILVYSTCSIDPDENEAVVKRALKENGRLKLVAENMALPENGFGGGYWAKIRSE